MSPKIHATFWSDPDVESRSPEIKLTLLWIMTSPYTNIIGICQNVPRRFAFDTGLDAAWLEKTLNACAKMFIVVNDKIWIKNFIAHQFGRGDKLANNNVAKALVKGLQDLPEPLRLTAFDHYPELKPLASPSIPLGKPSGKPILQGIDSAYRLSDGTQQPLPLASPCQGEEKRGEERLSLEKSQGSAEGGTMPTVDDVIAYGFTQQIPAVYSQHFCERKNQWIKKGAVIEWQKILRDWWTADKKSPHWTSEKTAAANGVLEQLEAEVLGEKDSEKRRALRDRIKLLKNPK